MVDKHYFRKISASSNNSNDQDLDVGPSMSCLRVEKQRICPKTEALDRPSSHFTLEIGKATTTTFRSDVFKHHLGFLVLKFNSFQSLMHVTAKGSYLLYSKMDSCELIFKPWNEGLFHGVGELVNVWILLQRVPFCYWSVKGVCMLASVLGTPQGFDHRTLENLGTLSTITDVVCVKMSVLSSRPTSLLASLDSRNESLVLGSRHV
ncbi:hypothetical protein POM88_039402 [Heracleum sosnowskyi]|uniref:DUF4283 domain-containing protein n=1 Tax=Heracleum sosnowskyi TaxID=360622 RepID=A0AAD8M7T2_9APIA|nr:hypothetical protein POM88_039402 [Heracleum sosnowskyi]